MFTLLPQVGAKYKNTIYHSCFRHKTHLMSLININDNYLLIHDHPKALHMPLCELKVKGNKIILFGFCSFIYSVIIILKNIEITFAKWWWVVPLRGMSWNTADNDLTNKFIAFVTEETQSFSCLVTVLVQGLVAIIGNARIWAWIIFHWQEKKYLQKPK